MTVSDEENMLKTTRKGSVGQFWYKFDENSGEFDQNATKILLNSAKFDEIRTKKRTNLVQNLTKLMSPVTSKCQIFDYTHPPPHVTRCHFVEDCVDPPTPPCHR